MKLRASLYSCISMLFLLVVEVNVIHSQISTDTIGYTQQEAFTPLDYPTQSAYRSADGKPGPEYWQNSADYEIDVTLDPDDHSISGSISIHYTNNSPDELDYLWLQLDQNLFAEGSRGSKTWMVDGNRYKSTPTEGYSISKVAVTHFNADYSLTPLIAGTRMQIRLDKPLEADGGEIKIRMNFEYQIPEFGADRMGRQKFEDGWMYLLAQWYPRMAVYDDIRGWNVKPYLGAGEFYLEYGTFSYKVTAPSDFVVLGSGTLQNPDDVLTEKVKKRLSKARESDKTITIIGKDELNDKKVKKLNEESLTWHYMMENSRDIAFGASKGAIWDAARINLPTDDALAMSFYPKESIGTKKVSGWERSTEYTKASIENNSYWYEYPYSTAVNIAGIVGGMEYPAVSFCAWDAREAGLWGVTEHEFGHNWFPMIVGSNEREYAWMDEGFNTFLNTYSALKFNDGEYAPWIESGAGALGYMLRDRVEPSNTYPDMIQESNMGGAFYFKPAAGLIMLREVILGPKRFDFALKTYIERWAYKHPQPLDFFRTMNSASGENLDWFWKGWFLNDWLFDQSVEEVSYKNGEFENGALISLKNHRKLVLPVLMEITEVDGDVHNIKLPVDIWARGNNWTTHVETDSEIAKVVLDSNRMFPDLNRTNNVWEKE